MVVADFCFLVQNLNFPFHVFLGSLLGFLLTSFFPNCMRFVVSLSGKLMLGSALGGHEVVKCEYSRIYVNICMFYVLMATYVA
jgi:hypothetical protein